MLTHIPTWMYLLFGGLGSSIVSSSFAASLVVLSHWLGRRAAREDLRREQAVQLADAIARFTAAAAVRDDSRANVRADALYDVLRMAGRLRASHQHKHRDFTAWLIGHVRELQEFLAAHGSPSALSYEEHRLLMTELGTLQSGVETWADSPKYWRRGPRHPVQLSLSQPAAPQTPVPRTPDPVELDISMAGDRADQ